MKSNFTSRELRDVFGQFGTGVTVITAVGPAEESVGVTANSLTSVSLDPPLLLWCIANKSSSIDTFTLHKPFNVHFLAEDQEDLAMHYSRSASERIKDPAAQVPSTEPAKLDGVVVRLECQVEALYPGGDHTIVIGRVMGFERFERRPLMFHNGKFGQLASAGHSPGSDPYMGDGWV